MSETTTTTTAKKEKIPASSLPVTPKGQIYHLELKPNELADGVIIVGDPGRVTTICEKFLQTKEVESFHRGLRSITGITKGRGKRVSIVTSGMGTPSLEIVFNELVALREINLQERTEISPRPKPLTVIRVGTSGALRADTELGTAIISSYGVGLDNTGLFVDVKPDEVTEEIEKRVTETIRNAACKGSRFGQRISPYVAKANSDVVEALKREAKEKNVVFKVGLTASAAGFFANQGRKPFERVQLTVPNIDDVVGNVNLDGIKGLEENIHVENMEMEASALFHLGNAVGYRCGAICVTIAQRRLGTFMKDPSKQIEDASETAIRALESLI